jgi:sec-independent protein translocase protein TatA
VLPLQFGVPGGMEILIVLLIAIMLFGLPLVVLGGLFLYVRRVERKVDEVADRLDE